MSCNLVRLKDFIKKLPPSAGAGKGCRDPTCSKEEHYFHAIAGALLSLFCRRKPRRRDVSATGRSGAVLRVLRHFAGQHTARRDLLTPRHLESRWWDPGWGVGLALFYAEPCGGQLGAKPG